MKTIFITFTLVAVLALAGCSSDTIRVPDLAPNEVLVIMPEEIEPPCNCEVHASTAPAGTKCKECKWMQATNGKPYCLCTYEWLQTPQ